MRRFRGFVGVVGLVVLLPLGAGVALAADEPTSRVSLTDGDGQVEKRTGYVSAAVSGDGRYVAFFSRGALVPGDRNGVEDVYVRDRVAGRTVRVSAPAPGRQVLGGSVGSVSISADGRYVAFDTPATGLLSRDPVQGGHHVYVRDLLAGTTVQVDTRVGESGSEALISGDGRSVLYRSYSSRTGAFELVRRDLHAGTRVRVDVNITGRFPNIDFDRGATMTRDGRFVAFSHEAFDLVAGDTNGSPDLFVRDLTAGITRRVNVTGAGGQTAGLLAQSLSLSDDGRLLAYTAGDDPAVPGDTNLQSDVFVRDLVTGAVTIVSRSPTGLQSQSGSSDVSISADGRRLVFSSGSGNIVDGDTNQDSDVFVHERATGVNRRVSTGPGGVQVRGTSFAAALSADGRVLVWTSDAPGLVPGDTNGTADVFARQLG